MANIEFNGEGRLPLINMQLRLPKRVNRRVIRLSVLGNFLSAGEDFEFFGFEAFEVDELVLA